MFQIKYNNVFLDLVPNQECEIERNSPLFLIDNFFAEYSTPISIAYSDSNARALGWYFFQSTVRTRIKLPVEVYDRATYKCNAILAIESAGINNSNKGASTASGYLLIGISDFYQAIQTKLLTDLKLGGIRTFNFTTYYAFDGTGGWWQHFHSTWNGNDDYVFATCRNETWTGSDDDPFSTGYMNALNVTSQLFSTLMPGQPVVPFTRVKFILESIFKESGWQVDFSGLNDTQWEKMILWSVKPLFIAQQTYQANAETGELQQFSTPIGQINIKLADFMPLGYTCAQFISALCLRYGWAIVPSASQRSCRFIALKEQKNKPVKDWTTFGSPAASTQITVDEKLFAFKNDFEGNDNFPSAPDFSNVTLGNAVQNFEDLPTPDSGAYDTVVIFVYKENQFYQVVTNDDNTARMWDVFADNIYDVEPPDGVEATDTFETKCTTLPVYKTLIRTQNNVDYYMWLPTCQQSRTEKFGIKTLLYHGTCAEMSSAGVDGSHFYPFASSTHLRHDNLNGGLTWSNVFNHKDIAENDYGIISYWFQPWLDIIRNVEDAFIKRFSLPLHELLNFKWDDTILDNNIPYLVKKFIEPLPYKGYIECTMQRISLTKPAAIVVPGAGDTQKIYLRLSFENYQYNKSFYNWEDDFTQDQWSDAITADIKVRSYSDSAGSVPLMLTGFAFKTISKTYHDNSLNQTSTQTWVMNGNELDVNLFSYKILEADYYKYLHIPSSPGSPGEIHTLASWHLRNELQLVFDPSYTIIP